MANRSSFFFRSCLKFLLRNIVQSVSSGLTAPLPSSFGCRASTKRDGDSRFQRLKPHWRMFLAVLTSLSCVVMRSTTLGIDPFFYSKTCSTFRTVDRDFMTTRADLGSVLFIRFCKFDRLRIRFILQIKYWRVMAWVTRNQPTVF